MLADIQRPDPAQEVLPSSDSDLHIECRSGEEARDSASKYAEIHHTIDLWDGGRITRLIGRESERSTGCGIFRLGTAPDRRVQSVMFLAPPSLKGRRQFLSEFALSRFGCKSYCTAPLNPIVEVSALALPLTSTPRTTTAPSKSTVPTTRPLKAAIRYRSNVIAVRIRIGPRVAPSSTCLSRGAVWRQIEGDFGSRERPS